MSKFKLTQTATEVQNILNNSLQKPTGLSKTKLVGVGVNGQENIEIGDNLTLANGKLSSATGSLPSTVKFDQEGNRTVGKDLGVDGKLKLKSLVSASNPDGDITKELGGGGGGGGTPRHGYMIDIIDSCYYIVYTTKDYNLPIGQHSDRIRDFLTNDNYKELRYNGWYPAYGYTENAKPVIRLKIDNNTLSLWIYNTNDHSYTSETPSYTRFYITKLF